MFSALPYVWASGAARQTPGLGWWTPFTSEKFFNTVGSHNTQEKKTKEKVRAPRGSNISLEEQEFLEGRRIRSSMQPTRSLKLTVVGLRSTTHIKPARGPTSVSEILKAGRKQSGSLQRHFSWSLQMGRSLRCACRRHSAACWMFSSSWVVGPVWTGYSSLVVILFITCFPDGYSASYFCAIFPAGTDHVSLRPSCI